MVWQDTVIVVVSIVFIISLTPQVVDGFKRKVGLIKLSTSIPTAIGLFALAATYYTLSLYLSTVVSMILGFIWITLAWQRLKYRHD